MGVLHEIQYVGPHTTVRRAEFVEALVERLADLIRHREVDLAAEEFSEYSVKPLPKLVCGTFSVILTRRTVWH
jgi:hypothetical protein